MATKTNINLVLLRVAAGLAASILLLWMASIGSTSQTHATREEVAKVETQMRDDVNRRFDRQDVVMDDMDDKLDRLIERGQ